MARLPQDRERYRRALRAMLGWPLTRWRRGVPRVEIVPVTAGGGYAVYRLQIEVLPGVLYYGILFINGASALEEAPRRHIFASDHEPGRLAAGVIMTKLKDRFVVDICPPHSGEDDNELL